MKQVKTTNMEYQIKDDGLYLKIVTEKGTRIYKNEEIEQFGKTIVSHYKTYKKAKEKMASFDINKVEKFKQLEIESNEKEIQDATKL